MGEDSTGVTLYLERILRALQPQSGASPLYIPYDAGLDVLVSMIRQGEICRYGSADAKDQKAEAEALGYAYFDEWAKSSDLIVFRKALLWRMLL